MMVPFTDIEQADFKEGAFILIDKPLGWTSFDVVNKVRFAIKHRLKVKKIKVGHSGTLDPSASGLLILCTGKFTKKLEELTGLDKQYTGTIRLGSTTASYDGESDEENIQSTSHLSQAQIIEARKPFVGSYFQVPPVYSAIKRDGVAAYVLARRGESVEMKTRPVVVHDLAFTRIEIPEVDFRVDCEKGFYVRSLAHDFGQALGVGGYLSALRRTHIGPYDVHNAWALDTLIELLQNH